MTSIKDYLEKVQEKFPYLTKKEIEAILEYGMYSYVRACKMHCDVNLHKTDGERQGIFRQDYFMNRLRVFQYWVTKWRMKERYLFKMRKLKWDGYYYIGITKNEKEHVEIKGKRVIFHNVFFTKLENELHHQKHIKKIWRVPMIADCGWKFYVQDFETTKAEYVGENNYEKYHQCFLGRFNHGYAPDVDTSFLNDGCSECDSANNERE